MRISLHIWLLAAVLLITVIYAVSRKRRVDKKRCIQAVTVILTLFSGLRSWQMGDVYHYCYVFLECNSESWKLDFSSRDTIGMQLLYRAVGQMSWGFEVCLFLIAAFSAISLGVFIFRYSTSPYLSYLIYICLGSYIFTLSALKQTVAMAFLMWAMVAVIKSKPWRFLMLTGLATLFHLPACIFLVAYFAAHKKIDWLYFAELSVITGCIAFFRNEIVQLAASLYYEGELAFDAAEGVGGKFVILLGILLLAIIIHPPRDSNPVYRYLFNMMVLATILQSFSVYDNVFTRLADYYFQFFVVFVPLLLDSRVEITAASSGNAQSLRLGYCIPKELRIIATLLISVMAVVIYVETLNAGTALLSEFRFIWEADAVGASNMLGG